MFVTSLYIKMLQEMSSLFFEKLDNSSQIFPKYDTTIFRHFLLYAAKSVINCTICRNIPSLTYFLLLNVTYIALFVTFLSNLLHFIGNNPNNNLKVYNLQTNVNL
jgi:hypothetical protein